MLHILFCILKVIGLILAAIIGIVVFLICIVLFNALRYEISAKCSRTIETADIDIKFSWLFRMISGYIVYKNQKLDWKVKFAWKEFRSSNEKTTISEVNVDEIVNDAKADTEEIAKKITTDIMSEVVEEATGSSENKSAKKIKKNKNKKNKNKKKSLKEKIQCAIQNISDKITVIQEWKEKILAFIQNESHNKAFQKLLKELRHMLKKMRPKKLQGNLEFGFEDPYTTGYVLAFASMLYPFYGNNIDIKPNFEERILAGDIYLKGKIKISYFAVLGTRMILNKNVRMTIQDIMKFISKK